MCCCVDSSAAHIPSWKHKQNALGLLRWYTVALKQKKDLDRRVFKFTICLIVAVWFNSDNEKVIKIKNKQTLKLLTRQTIQRLWSVCFSCFLLFLVFTTQSAWWSLYRLVISIYIKASCSTFLMLEFHLLIFSRWVSHGLRWGHMSHELLGHVTGSRWGNTKITRKK